ncbi:AMP-binding protein [Actinomadura sp. NEAU-AAG7]|uniref:AMP-binding protein n=1 Tax=Actinomadura sp. NEAU-AAG7 TaxID=2839640 RepID=UPI0027E06CEE|nr:AMP-binding protein [Actinomadura sp. NEAU-AAG7]
MTLAETIAPGPGGVRLHFPSEKVSVPYGELWKSGEAMGCLRARSDGRPVAVALSNTRACVTVLVGAIAAGVPLVSVPMPPRGSDLDWYAGFIRRICAVSGAATLVVDAAFLPMIPPMDGIEFLSYEDAVALTGPRDLSPESFTLTQFTSGSTADPKGVVLPGHKITANLLALMEWLGPEQGDGTCTWLPLSHDMGLIGMFLGSLTAVGRRLVRDFDLVMMTPQGFLRGPGRWLATCEEFGSTFTAAPNYAFDMVARKRGTVSDLSRLRCCIAGGEPIRAASLERFTEVMAGMRFDPAAFAPAYGMAEAVLAVTGTPQDERWRTAELDAIPGGAEFAAAQGHRIVSSGRPLPGYEVRIEGEGVGEILVRGPSIADSYADGARLPDVEGWFHTRDIGAVHEGELYVFGRTDDVFQVAGRNIYAIDVEAYASEVDGIRTGRVVAVPERGELTVVAECEPGFTGEGEVQRLVRELSNQIVTRVGVAPRRVLLARRGILPLTSSGKIRRRPLVAALESDDLKILDGSQV